MLPSRLARLVRTLVAGSRPGLGGRPRRRPGRGAARRGCTPGEGIERYVRTMLSDPDRTDDFRLLAERAVPRRHRPRHVRADRVRSRGLGRRADLDRGQRLERAADDLQAGQGQGARADRRRHPLHDQPGHRGRGGGQVHRRRQPAGALRERLPEADPDAHRLSCPPRLRHGLPPDRLPVVQAAGLPAPARDGPPLGAALSRASTSS